MEIEELLTRKKYDINGKIPKMYLLYDYLQAKFVLQMIIPSCNNRSTEI